MRKVGHAVNRVANSFFNGAGARFQDYVRLPATRCKSKTFCLRVLLSFVLVPTWVFAQSLDIFLQGDDVPSSVRPNILFVVDVPQGVDEKNQRKVQQVKQTLAETVQSLSGVNVGLVSVAAGGSDDQSGVLVPMQAAEQIVGRAQAGEPILQSGADDVEAFTGAEKIVVDASTLHFGSGQVPTREVHEVSVPVSVQSGHSVERISDGRFLGAPANFEFDGVSRLGLRFDALGIPAQAKIESAHLALVADTPGTGKVRFSMSLVSGQRMSPFSSHRGGLAAQLMTPMSTTEWSIDSDWAEGAVYQSPDISGLVQDVIDRKPWSEEQTVVLLLDHLSGSSDRSIYLIPDAFTAETAGLSAVSTQSAPTQAKGAAAENVQEWTPRLYVKYSTLTGPPLSKPKVVGLRFSNVPVPKGAEVKSARLNFTAAADAQAPATFTVRVEATGDAKGFEPAESVVDFMNRAKQGDGIPWAVTEAWRTNENVAGPDVTALVQRVVQEQEAWCGNNAMTFFIEPADLTASRVVYGREQGASMQATLEIEYEPHAGCTNAFYTAHPVVGPMEDNQWSVEFETLPIRQGATLLATEWVSPDRLNKAADGLVAAGDGDGDGDGKWSVVALQGEAVQPLSAAALPQALNQLVQREDWVLGQSISMTLRRNTANDGALQRDAVLPPSLRFKVANDGLDFQRNTARAQISTAVKNLPVHSSIPAAQLFADAAQYFQGVKDKGQAENQHQCQSNHMVVLSYDTALGDQNPAMLGDGNIKTYHINLTEYEDPQQLRIVLDNLFSAISVTPATFAQPGITVNQFNRLNHRDAVFYALFGADSRGNWSGNLKRFHVAGDPPALVDDANQHVVDDNKGLFRASAKSVWSASADGAQVGQGGVVSVLPDDPADRKIFTFLQPKEAKHSDSPAVLERLHEDNEKITSMMLEVTDAHMRERVLQWARGVDVKDWDGDGDTTEFRKELGALIHSAPVLATYGGSDKAPDITVFFGTNDGKFHAVDAESGVEQFAFVPQSLLPVLSKRYAREFNFNEVQSVYGVDGSPALWVHDANNDAQIEIGTDHVYVYFGLRRGGRDYFALDVTDRSAPKLLWHIQGGRENFELLGQSWAQPVKAKVNINGEPKDVVLLSGGFDAAADAEGSHDQRPAEMGRAIYMVDAKTGERLWWASAGADEAADFTDERLIHAIPAAVAVVDVNGDELTDQMYVGDLGGQVWRFDVHNGRQTDALVSGGVIASLGKAGKTLGDTTHHTARQFFFSPELALVNHKGAPALAVALGSGAINKPLTQQTKNSFFVLFQKDVFSAPEQLTTILEKDLADYSLGASSAANKDTVDVTNSDNGWFISFEQPGEKALATPLVLNNHVLVTTYTPTPPTWESCQSVVGQGRVYLMDVMTGESVKDLDGSGTIDLADRSRLLKSSGIPPAPVVLFSQASAQPLVLVGSELPLRDVKLGLESDWQTVYWSD